MILVRYFATLLAESFKSFGGIQSTPAALFALSYLSISFISSLDAGGKSKLKEFGKTFFYGYSTWMTLALP